MENNSGRNFHPPWANLDDSFNSISLYQTKLTLFFPIFSFEPPENIRNFGFLMFSGRSKRNIWRKGLNSKTTDLTHYTQLVSFFTLWKHEKTRGFLMFSGGIERDRWHEMVWHGSTTVLSEKYLKYLGWRS